MFGPSPECLTPAHSHKETFSSGVGVKWALFLRSSVYFSYFILYRLIALHCNLEKSLFFQHLKLIIAAILTMYKQRALNTHSKLYLERLELNPSLCGIIPFNPCNFSLINRVAEFNRWLVILTLEHKLSFGFYDQTGTVSFFFFFGQSPLPCPQRPLLPSTSPSFFLQCEVWVTLVRESCNTRSAQMRTSLTLTQLAHFFCHFSSAWHHRKKSGNSL